MSILFAFLTALVLLVIHYLFHFVVYVPIVSLATWVLLGGFITVILFKSRWYLWAFTLIFLTAGDFEYLRYVFFSPEHTPPPPSGTRLIDFAYIMVYPLMFSALISLSRKRYRFHSRTKTISSLLVLAGIALVMWTAIVYPALNTSLLLTDKLSVIMYPTLNIILFVLLMRLWIDGSVHNTSFYLLNISVLSILVSDTLVFYAHQTGIQSLPEPASAYGPTFFLFLLLAALHPSRAHITDTQTKRITPQKLSLVFVNDISGISKDIKVSTGRINALTDHGQNGVSK